MLLNSFRAVARRQPAAATPSALRAVSSASAPTSTVEINTMDQLSGFLEESADPIVADSPEDVLENGIIDPVPRPAIVPGSSRAQPILKGFVSGQFVQPRSFTHDVYTQKPRMTKRPKLGPDASTSRYLDVFHQLDIDPLEECLNSSLLSRFVTTMGKIKGRNETNLTWKNQRKVGKAIRRAKMMGIIPQLSRRPLLWNVGRR
ncbi:hypothetical protein BN946_scf184908.g80 [Trametes cinnabarina]|uniref:Small ribosomal subunit protein bS18m n=1 Tax=Pycnoporus cinnabarinus TaxID=5643 RepID=A0A060SA30_PYCCI|nr:hypothetical protein BN946_scf184908.g80 [Trametes cinnabarina]